MGNNRKTIKQILLAGVAAGALTVLAGSAFAGGVNVSVGGHSIVSTGALGGSLGSAGGTVGGVVGGVSGGVGGVTSGVSSSVGGVSSGVGGSGSGFFSGGASGATSPNFFSGAANFSNQATSVGPVPHTRRALKHESTRIEAAIPRKKIGGRTVKVTTSPAQETARLGGKKGVNAKVVNDPEAQVTLGDGHTQGATVDTKIDETGTKTPATTTVDGFNAPSSTTGSTGNAGVASTDVGLLNGPGTTTGSQNGTNNPLTDTNVGVLNQAGGTTGNSGNTNNAVAATNAGVLNGPGTTTGDSGNTGAAGLASTNAGVLNGPNNNTGSPTTAAPAV